MRWPNKVSSPVFPSFEIFIVMTAVQTQIQTAFAAVLALLAGAALTLVSCSEKKSGSLSERVEDRVNDALDRRPNEKVKDVAEDVEKAAGDIKESVKDAINK